jgi:hypothetical protein
MALKYHPDKNRESSIDRVKLKINFKTKNI